MPKRILLNAFDMNCVAHQPPGLWTYPRDRAETDADGVNLAYAVTPETFADFADLVVPELQRRGCYKLDYPPGTVWIGAQLIARETQREST